MRETSHNTVDYLYKGIEYLSNPHYQLHIFNTFLFFA